jgi:hypothetical protein
MLQKFKILLLSLVFVTSLVSAQIRITKSRLDFSPTNEQSADFMDVWLYNEGSDTVEILEIITYDRYNSRTFYVDLFFGPRIAPGDSMLAKCYFTPKHNITFNQELLFITEPSQFSFTIDVRGQGKYQKTYYNQTENKSEEDLKAALKTIITTGYVSLGYNTARDKMFMEYDNQKVNGQGASVNSLECVYTGRKALSYTSRTDAQTNNNFNTEHTFPQGFFSQNEPMRSDLHHLFPTDENANNSRNNFAFGIATQPYQNDATNNPSHLGANGLYEPRDQQKGRTARAMMYFVLRYQDYTNFFASQENILRQWHDSYPPNAVDIKRNDDIFSSQKNRNPFVDYPQLLDRISNIVGTSTEAPRIQLDYPNQITCQPVLDSASTINFSIPFVNNGNQSIKLRNFISNANSITVLVDSLEILPGEAEVLPVAIDVKDTSGIFSSSIQFHTNYSLVSQLIPIQYEVIKTSTGLNNRKLQRWTAYPNPSNGEVFVKTENEGKLRVLNQMGQVIYEQELTVGLNLLNLPEIPAQMILLQMQDAFQRVIIY